MAENKKSFILYADTLSMVEKLPNEKAGELFKMILEYVNDKHPNTDDLLLQIAFEPIKLQLKRDLKQWEDKIENKSIGGRIGNLKRWNLDLYNLVNDKKIDLEEAESIAKSRILSHTDKKESLPIAKIADTVTVNDTVTVTVNDIKKEKEKEYRKFAHLKISFSEVEKIKAQGYLQNQIDGILDSIENYKKNTSYTSLYLTALKWLKKEYPSVVSKNTENIEYNYKFFDIPITEEYNFTPAQIIEFCKQGKYKRL